MVKVERDHWRLSSLCSRRVSQSTLLRIFFQSALEYFQVRKNTTSVGNLFLSYSVTKLFLMFMCNFLPINFCPLLLVLLLSQEEPVSILLTKAARQGPNCLILHKRNNASVSAVRKYLSKLYRAGIFFTTSLLGSILF